MKNKRTIRIVVLVLCLVLGISYAFFAHKNAEDLLLNTELSMDVLDRLDFSVDKDLNLSMNQKNFTSGGEHLSDTIYGTTSLLANDKTNEATAYYDVMFEVSKNNFVYTTEEAYPEIILTVTDPEGRLLKSKEGLQYVEYKGVSGFDITTINGSIPISSFYKIESHSSKVATLQKWTFTVTFINLDTNQKKNAGKSLNAGITFTESNYDDLANYEVPIIRNVDITTTDESITLDVDAIGGSNSVYKYLYSKDDGRTWEKSIENVYTFNNLDKRETYPLQVKVVDVQEQASDVFSESIIPDTYVLPSITNVDASISQDSLKIKVTAKNGTGTVTKYYYSIDNGASWEITNSNTYEFTGLISGETYYLRVKVVDSNNRQSTVYSQKINTKFLCDSKTNLAGCIKSLYTGQGANGIYYHNGTLPNGAGDSSYRYAGSSESVNNFVCFGSDAEECPNDNLYRIIGVFDNKVKLIKYDYATKEQLGTDGDYNSESVKKIAYYYWNYSNESSSTNDWTLSRLNKTNLNTNYLNNLGTNWTDKIATTTWNVGGMSWANGANTNAKTAYDYELGANKIDKTYDAKIGLMYLSEYYYSAAPVNWTKPGYDSTSGGETRDYRSTTNQNWMYMGFSNWTISPRLDDTKGAFHVNTDGSGSYRYVEYGESVRPTFILESDVLYNKGNGSKSNPFRIYMSPTIKSVTINTAPSTIEVSINALKGTNNITSYKISTDGGSTWITVNSSNETLKYNITGLKSNTTYNIMVKAIDIEGKDSSVYSISAKTKEEILCSSGILLADCIKSKFSYQGYEGLYLHDSTLATGAEDNSYRYAGSSKLVNNYVCFGMEGTTCDEEHLYRIIGAFDDDADGEYNIKLIKNKSLGDIAFDSNNSNVWNTSTINKNTLNRTYLTGLGSYANMIRETAWNVGGHDTSLATAKTFLDREKVSQASLSKIGLMYISDYGYAAHPDAWTTNLGDYNNANTKANNWMFTGKTTRAIIPRSSSDRDVFYVSSNGNANYGNSVYAYAGDVVLPVLYLNSNIVLKSGNGTSSSPYIIGE